MPHCQAALEKAWSCGSTPTVASPLLGAGARGAPVGEAGVSSGQRKVG